MEIKLKSAWDKLSMQEKALLIKLSVDNGVSSLKLIRDTYNLYSSGGDLAHKYDGNTEETLHIEISFVPTKELYITQQLDSIRNNALERSRKKTNVETTIINEADVYGRKHLINRLQESYNIAKSFYDRMLNDKYELYKKENPIRSEVYSDINYINNDSELDYYANNLNNAKQVLDDAKKGIYNGEALNNCIANLSEMFPHGLPYGNQTFKANPKKYGFSLIDTWDVKPGDLIQHIEYGVPAHAMIYNGINEKGKHTFNYSDGGNPYMKEGIIYGGYGTNKHYPKAISNDGKHLWDVDVYRYTGTPQDSIQWSNEWELQYGTQKALGGSLSHKKSGEGYGESQDLNTKTYKEKKESSAYPMYYNVLSLSLGDTDLPGSILRALMYGNSKDPSIYTGSYYFGDKWGFGTSLELPQNRNLISLYLDGDTTGFKQLNGKPIVLDGDTLTQPLYEGNLLPLDTIYLRPESKATIARMTKDKDLLKINNSFPGWMSYSSKYNFLDSPYFLDKYEGKVMDDANNLNISFKQNSDGSYYADVFDLWDLTGTGGYKAGARLEKKLATDSIENNGPFILRLHIPIVFNRDSVSDGRFLDAISVRQWQKEIDDTNQKSTGGPLYPFSFEKNPFLKTPIVRY